MDNLMLKCAHGVSLLQDCERCKMHNVKSANKRQVGGAHYKTDYEHWDFVREVLANNYLLGNATKYVSRWRKKNGVEDLEKALHYIDKARETNVRAFGILAGEAFFKAGSFFYPAAVLRFADSCGCGVKEAQAIWHIACAEWDKAEEIIKKVVEAELAIPSSTPPQS